MMLVVMDLYESVPAQVGSLWQKPKLIPAATFFIESININVHHKQILK